MSGTWHSFGRVTHKAEMKFISTRRRDGSDEEYSFEEALLSGYAPDGGLFVPSTIPRITANRMHDLSQLSYPRLAYEILRMFVPSDEVGDEDLKCIVAQSYDEFDDRCFVPVKRLGGAYIAELFHGPTYCFKVSARISTVSPLFDAMIGSTHPFFTAASRTLE